MERVIVGYDGSQGAERALERAAELAQALPARLLVVSVTRSLRVAATVPALEPVEAPVPVVPGPVATGASTPWPVPEMRRPEPDELAQHQLERARMSLTRKRVEAEYIAEVGEAAATLLAVAEEHDADLIVVGSREHGFLDVYWAGTWTRRWSSAPGCDVLLVY
jgi:nucleotide-binding universal stress UspA family protein